MIINGNEVNHLFLKGQQFDLSYVGKQVKTKNTVYDNMRINRDGTLYPYKQSGTVILHLNSGIVCTILATYNNFFYIRPTDSSFTVDAQMWVSKDNIEFLN